jgi:hypothetical protein
MKAGKSGTPEISSRRHSRRGSMPDDKSEQAAKRESSFFKFCCWMAKINHLFGTTIHLLHFFIQK